jgi:hypothetical protein
MGRIDNNKRTDKGYKRTDKKLHWGIFHGTDFVSQVSTRLKAYEKLSQDIDSLILTSSQNDHIGVEVNSQDKFNDCKSAYIFSCKSSFASKEISSFLPFCDDDSKFADIFSPINPNLLEPSSIDDDLTRSVNEIRGLFDRCKDLKQKLGIERIGFDKVEVCYHDYERDKLESLLVDFRVTRDVNLLIQINKIFLRQKSKLINSVEKVKKYVGILKASLKQICISVKHSNAIQLIRNHSKNCNSLSSDDDLLAVFSFCYTNLKLTHQTIHQHDTGRKRIFY